LKIRLTAFFGYNSSEIMQTPWYTVGNADAIPSPALLVYPDRVEENIRRMIRMAGGVERLRPHMKTNKLPEVVQMQMAQGITKFKCATIAEAEMAAACLVPDILLAYQPVGPNVHRLVQLVQTFPATKFSALVDDKSTIRTLSTAAAGAGVVLDLFLDLDCGMHRTGVAPGPEAIALYRLLAGLPGLHAAGLHAYDGHIRDTDFTARTAACDAAFAGVEAMREQLVNAGLEVPTMVAGGTPTFPIHARRRDVECSPGTSVFWDLGYSTLLPDMDFLPAVLLLTRVISRPATNLLCLDLGHKAVASEGPHPRAELMGLPNAHALGHSEEHLSLETDRAGEFAVGSAFYAVPWHICPTVALHQEAVVIRNGRAEERWQIVGRTRAITI
jgi:D-serine deaminase-like pyridoxal phosphate-dependent protein